MRQEIIFHILICDVALMWPSTQNQAEKGTKVTEKAARVIATGEDINSLIYFLFFCGGGGVKLFSNFKLIMLACTSHHSKILDRVNKRLGFDCIISLLFHRSKYNAVKVG